jgi:alkylhydroperoxidase/carboxymuconolactone decarboxylase family protein YurZ
LELRSAPFQNGGSDDGQGQKSETQPVQQELYDAGIKMRPELKLHINGALHNGLSKEEIKEIFLQVAIYCGIPASLDAFKTASGVFKDRGI